MKQTDFPNGEIVYTMQHFCFLLDQLGLIVQKVVDKQWVTGTWGLAARIFKSRFKH